MNVFISYSVSDTALVQAIADRIKNEATVRFWDKSKQPGTEIWPTIFSWIDSADLVSVVITDKTMGRALSVGQEIGHAKKARKQIIPLVAQDVPPAELGFLAGITFIPLDLSDPTAALQSLQTEVARFQQANALRLQMEEQKKKQGIVVLAGVVLLLFLLGKD